jgi:outer membrane lipase/esterase
MTVSLVSLVCSRAVRLVGVCAFVSSAFLTGCGSGTTFEPLVPSRIVSFGDGWSDLGQTGARYTVNDGSINIWVQQLAASYGLSISASSSAGGLGFAVGDARVDSGLQPISSQISAFLAANSIATSDVLVVDAGVAELVALAAANATDTALVNAADLAGKALAEQVKRLKAAGARHVVIANAPDLGKTPYAAGISRVAALTAATRAFNDGLKIALADVTNDILLLDNEAYVNSIYASPAVLGTGGNATTPACSPSTAPSARNCTTATLNTGVTEATYNLYLFADDRHPTPAVHRLIGINAYNKIIGRW